MAKRLSGHSSTGRSLSSSSSAAAAQTTSASNRNGKRSIKVVVVGDGNVGKTCLLIAYTTKQFPHGDYVPTVFENYFGTQECQGSLYNLTLWDTAGQEDYERLRPLSYPGADVFLLCFSVDSIHSFQNIQSKWQPEIKQHCPKVPYILVGTKTDLRPSVGSRKSGSSLVAKSKEKKSRSSNCNNSNNADDSRKFVTREMGKKLAAKIKASKYVECSAKSMFNIEEVFIETIKAAYNLKDNDSNRRCVLL